MQVLIGLLIAMFGSIFQSPTGEADEILTQLSKIRLDKKEIYNIRDITLRRDVLTIALNRGTIAFLEPVNGRVTGAVFIGNGEVVAIPPDAIERQQIYRFTGTAILNETFQTAVLRFTDNTYAEIKKEISEHAQEDVAAEDIAQFDSWDPILARRAPALNMRLLADFLEPGPRPFFLGELNGEKTGWFDVIFDMRAAEELSIFQLRQSGTVAVADVWASFNQRSEARKPEAVAHESKAPVEVLSYEIDGRREGNAIDVTAVVTLKGRVEGARILDFELSPGLRVVSVRSGKDEPVPHYQSETGGLTVVLPQAVKPTQEFVQRFAYAGQVTSGTAYPSQRQQSIPTIKSSFPLPTAGPLPYVEYFGHKFVGASYHDQWLMEGLTRYLSLMATEGNDSGAELGKLLSDTRDTLKTIEGTGPIWLGQRLISAAAPDGYRLLYGKGVWVIHMLRRLLQEDGANRDTKFLAMMREFAETYDGKAVSTWDFQHVAEKFTEKRLDWFFEQWVFATGLPTYSLDYKVAEDGNGVVVEGAITQTGVPDGFTMPVRLLADSDFLGTVEVGESDGRFRFRTRNKPERVIIDEMAILTR